MTVGQKQQKVEVDGEKNVAYFSNWVTYRTGVLNPQGTLKKRNKKGTGPFETVGSQKKKKNGQKLRAKN